MAKLSVVATPIGNLDDITIRAIKTLFSVDAILCEDTRRAGILLTELTKRYGELFDQNPDWKPTLIAYYDEIEDRKIPEVIQLLLSGRHLALISDAGTPLISDPGFRIVRECLKRNIQVESIPGPSAVVAAITSSGLPTDSFTFLGYPPEKQNARRAMFAHLANRTDELLPTYAFYCAPHKLASVLTDLRDALDDIPIVIARELTKVHEQVWRGPVSEAITEFTDPKGEFVVLFTLRDRLVHAV